MQGRTDDLGAHVGIHHGIGKSGMLLRNEYLIAETASSEQRLRTGCSYLIQRSYVSRNRSSLGTQGSVRLAAAAKPETLLRWYRELIARKFDGSKYRESVGRPPV